MTFWKNTQFKVGFALALTWALAISVVMYDADTLSAQDTASFTLKDTCPPGFEHMADNTCELRSMYQLYPSVQNAGVGGLKTGLPPFVRDGFTPQQIDLGRYLFFDPALSVDGSMSCASCHDPDKGFADGLDRSIGVHGEKVTRSAPTLWNVAFQKRLFWDARADSLEEQAEGPLYAKHEMGNTHENLFETMNNIVAYKPMFADAFPDSFDGTIELDYIYTALSAFEASLISLNSRYDQYAHGFAGALTQREKEGLNIFRSFVARCADCHTPPLFTNQQIAVIGTPEPEGVEYDKGAELVTGEPIMRGAFKVPSLRNISKTAPYMHSGRFETLPEVAKFYSDGRGHAVPEEHKDTVVIHWHIWEPDLQPHEFQLIAEFLETLTDESFKPATPARLPSGLPLATSDKIIANYNNHKNNIPSKGE